MADYQLFLLDQAGVRISSFNTVLDFSLTLSANNIHNLSITVPDTFGTELLKEDYRIAIYRNGFLLGESEFLIQKISQSLNSDGEKRIVIGAAGANKILDWPIVAYNAASTQADKSGNADNLIKEIVDEAVINPTDTTRDMSAYLSAEADVGEGASVTKAFSRRKVLSVCQELAQASAEAGTKIYFDLIKSGTGFVLTTRQGQRGTDKTSSIILSPDLGNVGATSVSRDYSGVINYVYSGGQGQEGDRNVQTASNQDRIYRSIWGRIKEMWRDSRHATLDATLIDEAEQVLRDNREIIIANMHFLDIPGMGYDTHVTWGDLVKFQYKSGDPIYTGMIDPVIIRVGNDGSENINFRIRAEL